VIDTGNINATLCPIRGNKFHRREIRFLEQ
jgi:hypothetical protein